MEKKDLKSRIENRGRPALPILLVNGCPPQLNGILSAWRSGMCLIPRMALTSEPWRQISFFGASRSADERSSSSYAMLGRSSIEERRVPIILGYATQEMRVRVKP